MKIIIHWFRRDFRLTDNHALYRAGLHGIPVVPLFIFDQNILNELEVNDARLCYIHRRLSELKEELRARGSDLMIRVGDPTEIWKMIISELQPVAVHANEDYEPYAINRDLEVASILEASGSRLHLWKDHVIFHKNEIVKADGSPYTVFTPYAKKWRDTLKPELLLPYPSDSVAFHAFSDGQAPALPEIGFRQSSIQEPQADLSPQLLRNYDRNRNLPFIPGTSRVSTQLRFGTFSIRYVVKLALEHSNVWLNELIWRSFFSQLLFHFPESVNHEFKEAYRRIPWRYDEIDFSRWSQGMTGFPIVDAGMRELVNTGYMHNRVRMITAAFLCKQLLIDWRMGEAFFARHLFDYELASNVGNWQWAAGTGADAAPYFRIFNPVTQQQKFDHQKQYIQRWVPEYGTPDYPAPMIDLKFARDRCLSFFKENLNQR